MQPNSPYQQPRPVPHPVATPARRVQRNFLLPFIVSTVFTTIFAGLFVWAYLGMTGFKNNVDQKVAAANKIAVAQESQRKDNEFLEAEKSPSKTFRGSDTFGGITFKYPKTWSGYVEETGKGSTPLDGYFHPGVVPDLKGNAAFALRVKVIDKSYAVYVKNFDAKIKQGKLTAKAFAVKSQPDVVGLRIDGEVNTGQNNHMIVLPLRDKTIEISTEADQFEGDFENFVLASLNFIP